MKLKKGGGDGTEGQEGEDSKKLELELKNTKSDLNRKKVEIDDLNKIVEFLSRKKSG